jgi:hypothetical protein
MPLRILAYVILALSMPASASASSAWEEYNAILAKQCPSHHADAIVGGQYLDLLDAYDSTLSRAVKKKVKIRADISKKCSAEVAGFSCELGRSIEAYRQLGLLHNFATWSCHHIRCTGDYGICSQFPNEKP